MSGPSCGAPTRIGLRYAPPQRFDGYNYSIGRAVSISVYRSEGAP